LPSSVILSSSQWPPFRCPFVAGLANCARVSLPSVSAIYLSDGALGPLALKMRSSLTFVLPGPAHGAIYGGMSAIFGVALWFASLSNHGATSALFVCPSTLSLPSFVALGSAFWLATCVVWPWCIARVAAVLPLALVSTAPACLAHLPCSISMLSCDSQCRVPAAGRNVPDRDHPAVLGVFAVQCGPHQRRQPGNSVFWTVCWSSCDVWLQ
jgi:hypothetical protein